MGGMFTFLEETVFVNAVLVLPLHSLLKNHLTNHLTNHLANHPNIFVKSFDKTPKKPTEARYTFKSKRENSPPNKKPTKRKAHKYVLFAEKPDKVPNDAKNKDKASKGETIYSGR